MGLMARFTSIFGSKSGVALDKDEDTREPKEQARERQLELLLQLRQTLGEVAETRERLQRQTQQFRCWVMALQQEARQSLLAGREDLALDAIERKQAALARLRDLESQLQENFEQERNLSVAEQRLSTGVEDYRVRCRVAMAQVTAAETSPPPGDSAVCTLEESESGVPAARRELIALKASLVRMEAD